MDDRIWAIQARQLTKYYPVAARLGNLLQRPSETAAVDQIDLDIRQGELFGLLGPNGVGKTTLIKMLATLVKPSTGQAWVNGYALNNEHAVQASIGLVTTSPRSFYWRLSGRQNLAFFAALHNIPVTDEALHAAAALVGLEAELDKSVRNYSAGMHQKLAIVRGLLHRPRILFLDEPTNGLDPPAIAALHQLIREQLIGEQRITVVLTTHRLNEAETLCDRIAIMNAGRLQGLGTLTELRNVIGDAERYVVSVNQLPPGLQSELPESPQENSFSLPKDATVLNQWIDKLRGAGARILAIESVNVSLDRIFENLTRKDQATPENHARPAIEPEKKTVHAGIPFRRVAQAFLRRDWTMEKSYPLSFVMQFFGVFFSAAVFFFVASFVGEAARPALANYGGDYFAFILIGIAFQRYFGVGLTSFTQSLRQGQTTGTLEAMLTSPTSLPKIIFSSSLWQFGLTTFQVLQFLLVGVLFMGVQLGDANYLLGIFIVALTVFVFSSFGILSASFIMIFKRGDPINWIIAASSALLGGVYYPVEVLPDWLERLSWFFPITYALRALRQALLTGAGLDTIWNDLLVLFLFGIILFPLSLLVFRFAVRRAKTDGSLGQY